MKGYVVRFSLRQRIEHLFVMILFTLLVVTGFPQKFYDVGISQAIVNAVGGLDRVRWIHRIAGILFSVATVVHIVVATLIVLLRRAGLTMVPTKQDFKDSIRQIGWYLGLAAEPARFDRYDYRQKFEYWGMVIGSLVMVGTGLILYLPVPFTRLFPGELVPVALVAHSNEGLMAFLVVITWHIYNAHLSPDVFPFDTAIFTGKISRERMHHEHPLELARLEGESPAPTHTASHGEGSGTPPAPAGNA
ncbi:MAG TPA: cytochrome b/b6 domain-containing protein [Thermoanaerobaculia bacterium]|nr:cytochrome b/b6 domain-containing protein [Thermoanaerobaculia bacterium]